MMTRDTRWNYAEGLIGREIEVVSSTDPNFEQLRGTILDETRNMFRIAGSAADIMINKAGAVFRIGGHTLDGDGLVGRPEERLKRGRRKSPRRPQDAQ